MAKSTDTRDRPGPQRVSRQQRVADAVVESGSLTAAELADRFRVSLMTIHRDLDELAKQGVVRKFHGGVSAQPSNVFEANIRYRRKINRPEKLALATYARTLVEPGTAVMIDDSTTTLEVARLVGDGTPLTVVTNACGVAAELQDKDEIRLITVGGEYSRTHDSYLGTVCTDTIARLHVDLLLLSTSAMSTTEIFHQETDIVEVKRAMIRAAARTVLLMDHTKVDRSALHSIVPLSDVDQVVVDWNTSGAFVDALKSRGVDVVVVGEAGADGHSNGNVAR